MKLKFIYFYLLLLINFNLQAQLNINGVVRDTRETIPGASIFISGSKFATTTDNNGKFSFQNLPAGNYDILVKVVGYKPFAQQISLTNKSAFTDITLTEITNNLQEVVIKGDPNRYQYIQTFKNFFIGTTENAQNCKVLNTEILRTDYNSNTKTLTVSTDDFLVIENKALGYRINYLLKEFEYNYATGMLYYAGYPHFEELKGSKNKIDKWKKARNKAFYGSSLHFFQSLYQKNAEEHGFLLYKLLSIPNKNRLPDSVISTNIRRLTTGRNQINMLTFNRNDSLNYWLKEKSKPKLMSVINKQKIVLDTLVKIKFDDLKCINFTDELLISYTHEKEADRFKNSSSSLNRTIDMENYQLSIISMLEPSICFFESGLPINPRDFLVKGYWSFEKMADAVPNEFIPSKSVLDYKK